jgi:CubicO group peptidase (beta-lactamase class C family)
LPGSNTPGTVFDYGGSQWHLAGAIAAHVTNSELNQAFEHYIGRACGLEVFEFGNTSNYAELFTGHPDSLSGRQNPHGGGGAMANSNDMAKLLLLHLRGGICDGTTVLSQEGVEFMQVDRKGDLPSNFPGVESNSYGMGWWGREDLPGIFYDTGAYGSVAWLDPNRSIGGFVAVEDYARTGAWIQAINLIRNEIIPLVGVIVDETRAASQQ